MCVYLPRIPILRRSSSIPGVPRWQSKASPSASCDGTEDGEAMKTHRKQVSVLEDLPNIGKAAAAELRLIGICVPRQLVRRNPYALYERLNRQTGTRHDPCLLDTFIAAV